MTEITQILKQINTSPKEVPEELIEELFKAVNDHFRKVAQALVNREGGSNRNTAATGLVDEAFEPLNQLLKRQKIVNSAHLTNAFSQIVRRKLVNRARNKGAQKRGGGQQPVSIDDHRNVPSLQQECEMMIVLDDALSKIEQEHPQEEVQQVVQFLMLRAAIGLSDEVIATLLECSLEELRKIEARAKILLRDSFDR